MIISKDTQVSIEYTLKLDDDSVVDTNVKADPLTFTFGSGQIIPGLEKELEGMKAGENKKVTVSPEEGYGESNPKALVEVDKDKIPEGALKVGAMLQGQSADGASVYARVSEVRDSTVVLDHNHPLAGKTLHFDVKIMEVSDAPKEES
jgi:FKBP-type peptidyl-prolyl cis-trans isomerase SlyD